ncbi:histidine kinase-like ATPase [Ochromonadaceae sp. CCMP2298]|nr:histidine kinase-like ATPase [Ochromonadaceae sp. CCMP2298]
MESGVFVLELAFVAVGEVVQRSMASFLLQARDKDVRLTMQTIVEAGGAPSPTSPSARGGRARSSAEWMESGLAGECELDARYQLIGDGSRLGQVLRKLISNAMKFTNAGGAVNVTVQRVRDGMPGEVGIALPEDKRHLLAFPRAGSVRINLVDSGAGLSEQQVLDIGQENLQFNVSTHQGGGGSGLGLFISKGLVQQHGGKMTVTSPGLGLGVSTMLEFPLFDCFDPSAPRRSPMRHSLRNSLQFSFRAPSMSDLVEKSGQISQEETSKEDEVGLGLGAGRSGGLARVPYPLTIRPPVTGGHVGIADGLDPPQRPQALIRTALSTPEAARPAPAPASASASASASPGGGRHMLVVDDAVSNRKLLMRIFRLKGFVCEEAYDGQDALDKYANMCAQNTPPFAILMDYEMPVLNGPASTIQLRERGCTAFILGVTGNVMKDDKDFFVSCGADDVFIKVLFTIIYFDYLLYILYTTIYYILCIINYALCIMHNILCNVPDRAASKVRGCV